MKNDIGIRAALIAVFFILLSYASLAQELQSGEGQTGERQGTGQQVTPQMGIEQLGLEGRERDRGGEPEQDQPEQEPDEGEDEGEEDEDDVDEEQFAEDTPEDMGRPVRPRFEDYESELQKRNLTEEDARSLARQYGMSYEEFVRRYILEQEELLVADLVRERQALKEEDVIFERSFLPPTLQDSVKELNVFGYDIFKSTPAAFKPASVGPVDPSYVLGPGDELVIYLWGGVELQHQLTVDQDGTVFIPNVGRVFVSGVQYQDLPERMKQALGKSFEGLLTDPPQTFLDVSLTKLKSIKVFVMGEVDNPGGYNVSGYATVFNALYAVGGPSEKGSMREVRVIRDNVVIATVDIYDYLLKGKLIGDVRLSNNDMVFVPPRKRVVGVRGEVFRPAIYELKEGEDLQSLLELCGGVLPTAYSGRAQLTRIKPFKERQRFKVEREVMDIDIKSFVRDPNYDLELFDGDLLDVFEISGTIKNYVTIDGAINRPGNYELSRTPRLTTLINEAEGLLPDAYMLKADVIRTKPDQSREFISVNLQEAIEGAVTENIWLQDMDEVRVYSIYDVVSRQELSIVGEVRNQFYMEYADSITLYDLVFMGGGVEDPLMKGYIYQLRGDIIRVNPDGVSTRVVPFNLRKLMADRSNDQSLQPGDKVYIYRADVDRVLEQYVTIEGEVNEPGRFLLNEGMRPMDLILRAGGFTEAALRTEVEVNRVSPAGYPGEQISQNTKLVIPLTFERDLEGYAHPLDTVQSQFNFSLQHRDVVFVRKNPEWVEQRYVELAGEVRYPGTYILENRNETLLDLIRRAGGPTSEAHLFGAKFVRGGARIVVDLERLYEEDDEDENVILHENDRIEIPRRPNAVLVSGEVNNPGLIKYVDGLSVMDYINRAGGLTDSSNYVVYTKPNGESQRVSLGIFGGNPEVRDGSTIEVTKLPPPDADYREFLSTIFKGTISAITSVVTLLILIERLDR